MPKEDTQFRKGQSGNPTGRSKAVILVSELARQHTAEAIRALAEICEGGRGAKPGEQVQAALALLDRGWGKPQQAVEINGTNATTTLVDLLVSLPPANALLPTEDREKTCLPTPR